MDGQHAVSRQTVRQAVKRGRADTSQLVHPEIDETVHLISSSHSHLHPTTMPRVEPAATRTRSPVAKSDGVRVVRRPCCLSMGALELIATRVAGGETVQFRPTGNSM